MIRLANNDYTSELALITNVGAGRTLSVDREQYGTKLNSQETPNTEVLTGRPFVYVRSLQW